jgi:hypothetical protein
LAISNLIAEYFLCCWISIFKFSKEVSNMSHR